MKIKGSSYFLMIIMSVMVAVIISSLRMEYFTCKLLPLLVSSIIFVLAAIGLGRELLAGGKSRATIAGDEIARVEEKGVGWLRYLLTWVAGFFLAIYLAGFIIAIPLFILSYMKSHGTRWLTAIIFAVLTGALIYGIFELALGVDLYPGLLFSWLG